MDDSERAPHVFLNGQPFGIVGDGFEFGAEIEDLAPIKTGFTTSATFTTQISGDLHAALFGIPVHALPREESPTIKRWHERADRHLRLYTRPSERYYPDEKPGHAIAIDEVNELGNVTKRIYIPEAHIERLKGNEFEITTARSWVNWTPHLAARCLIRAIRHPRALINTLRSNP
ncbi:hypothetical protein [Pseudoclavibacter helvolus]|uniref:hypothetical protein n=1 Tax=Pseudoclavibacter helvolus TaxID=255205 RepID=UPI003C76E4B4